MSSLWKCNFPMTPSVRLSIGWSVIISIKSESYTFLLLSGWLVGLSVDERSVIISIKDGELYFHVPIWELFYWQGELVKTVNIKRATSSSGNACRHRTIYIFIYIYILGCPVFGVIKCCLKALFNLKNAFFTKKWPFWGALRQYLKLI